MVPTPKVREITNGMPPAGMATFLKAYYQGMKFGIEEGERRGFARGRRAWSEIKKDK